jgi:hypothetical protein
VTLAILAVLLFSLSGVSEEAEDDVAGEDDLVT